MAIFVKSVPGSGTKTTKNPGGSKNRPSGYTTRPWRGKSERIAGTQAENQAEYEAWQRTMGMQNTQQQKTAAAPEQQAAAPIKPQAIVDSLNAGKLSNTQTITQSTETQPTPATKAAPEQTQSFWSRFFFGQQPWTDEKGVYHDVYAGTPPIFAPAGGAFTEIMSQTGQGFFQSSTAPHALAVASQEIGYVPEKVIMGMKLSQLMGTATGLMGADTLANWMSLDNAKTSLSQAVTKIANVYPSMTPEEREQALIVVHDKLRLRDKANLQVETSARRNPITYAYKQAWDTANEAADFNIDVSVQEMEKYNPYVDYRSLEYKQAQKKQQLQTYGKPKYDEEGNPLNSK